MTGSSDLRSSVIGAVIDSGHVFLIFLMLAVGVAGFGDGGYCSMQVSGVKMEKPSRNDARSLRRG